MTQPAPEPTTEDRLNPAHCEDENPLDHVGEDVEAFFEEMQ